MQDKEVVVGTIVLEIPVMFNFEILFMCFICVFACVPCTSLVPVEDRRECHTPKTGLRDAYELMWVLKHLSSTPIMFKQSQIFLVYLLFSHILHPNHN